MTLEHLEKANVSASKIEWLEGAQMGLNKYSSWDKESVQRFLFDLELYSQRISLPQLDLTKFREHCLTVIRAELEKARSELEQM